MILPHPSHKLLLSKKEKWEICLPWIHTPPIPHSRWLAGVAQPLPSLGGAPAPQVFSSFRSCYLRLYFSILIVVEKSLLCAHESTKNKKTNHKPIRPLVLPTSRESILVEVKDMANVYYADPWHAPFIIITCLTLKGILFHALSLETLEAGNR